MGKVLIIGAGGVGGVVAHKCAQLPEVFHDITLASRTKDKCDQIAAAIKSRYGRTIRSAQLDADNVSEIVSLLSNEKPDLVVNVALPYQDLTIMEACLEVGVHYLDTANYEPPELAKFEYKWQWAYQERFQQAGLMAVLGCGFDPGVTNIFCAYSQKHFFDEIDTIDIVDCNGGSHGKAFATNFNPEVNIREITAPGRYWEQGDWHEVPALAVHQPFDFPGIGQREMYLLYHEELESLCQNIRGLKKIRFWMTFGQEYLTHLRVLENIGMTRIDAVDYDGSQVVPLKFLKKLLPDPASLAAGYKGKTCIGCVVQGRKNGKPLQKFIYNICDHEATYAEVGAQAISYTTGVPAMIGAKLLLSGAWKGAGVFNVEQLDPDPFMAELNQHGLPWQAEPWQHSIK